MLDHLSSIMSLRMKSKYSDTFYVVLPQSDITGPPKKALKRLFILGKKNIIC